MGGVADAWAHASLVSAVPADGSVVAASPERLTLRFDEPVSPLVTRLIAPDGRARDATATAHDEVVTVAPPTDLGSGTHVLSWRVISSDGHPVSGSLVFSIGSPSLGGLPTGQPASDNVVPSAIWATRVLLYLGLFVGVGGAVFQAWTATSGKIPPAVRGALWLGAQRRRSPLGFKAPMSAPPRSRCLP